MKKKVLVADDEEYIVSFVEDLLGDEYEMSHAYNGNEVLEKIKTSPPDVIILDLMMPGLGGFEILRILQSDPQTRALPVIISTARDFDHSTEALLKREPNVRSFINKPIKPQLILDELKNILG